MTQKPVPGSLNSIDANLSPAAFALIVAVVDPSMRFLIN